jgi:hypothetical protein
MPLSKRPAFILDAMTEHVSRPEEQSRLIVTIGVV